MGNPHLITEYNTFHANGRLIILHSCAPANLSSVLNYTMSNFSLAKPITVLTYVLVETQTRACGSQRSAAAALVEKGA